MDFSYSEEQLAARDIAAQILGDQSTPERLKTIEQQGERIDRQLWADLADAGLLGLAVE